MSQNKVEEYRSHIDRSSKVPLLNIRSIADEVQGLGEVLRGAYGGGGDRGGPRCFVFGTEADRK